jgi:hypothetical protein
MKASAHRTDRSSGVTAHSTTDQVSLDEIERIAI